MSETLKTVSIVLSAYNEEVFIEEAINSILEPFGSSSAAGKYALEVIVIDDFSTDRTLELLRNIDHPSLKVLPNETKGKVHAYNLGLRQSTGEFVILFAGDDLFNVASIAPRLDPIRDIEYPAVTFCALQAFRGSLGTPAQRFPRKGGGARAGGAIAMNRAFVERCLPIPTDIPNEDSWLCLHADFLDTFVADVDVVGMWYRLHDGNTSQYGSTDAIRQRNALMLRSQVYGLFEQKCADEMTEIQRVALSREIAAHAMARSGNMLSILLLFSYPVMRRIRAAFLSKPWLWKIRVRLGAKISGLVRSQVRGSPSQGLSRAVVHQGGDIVQPGLAGVAEVGAFGHELAHFNRQAIDPGDQS